MTATRLVRVLGAVGAVSALGMAEHASADTVYPDIAAGTTEDITLAGATMPQYVYSSNSTQQGGKDISVEAISPSAYTGPEDSQAPLDSQSYSSDSATIYTSGQNTDVISLDLEFTTAGTKYYGEAFFSPSEELTEIEYAPVAEPASWALLLAGTGLAGAAMRARRRSAPLAA
jgi:hypothetical protein